jgi:transcriptional regulator with XRE-family HTH domain
MDKGLRDLFLALARRVRRLRLERGLTQEDMADYGFALRQYQRIEAGFPVTVTTLWKLGFAFQVPIRAILPPDATPAARRRPKVTRAPRPTGSRPRRPARRRLDR